MWFILDALGIALGVLTWALLAFTDWVVVRFILGTWFKTTKPRLSWLPYTDMGNIIFLTYQFTKARVCKLCEGRWKPPRAHHCKTCRRCIFRMDHHCPWINNCVGLSNQKLFILFLCYTALASVATLVLLVSSAIYWLWSQSSWAEAAPPSSTPLMCSGVVAVECLAAVLFVSDFLNEQIESIQMNSTLVETYQRTHGERSCFYDHFRAVFGNSCYVWPWPFPSAPPPLYTEEAIPDDDSGAFVYQGTSPRASQEEANLGIAGEEDEAVDALGPASQVPTLGAEGSRPRARHKESSDIAGAD